MPQKYEREIEEILKNLGVPEEPLSHRVSRKVGSWRSRWQLPSAQLGQWRKYLTVQWFMVGSIGLVMFGFVLRPISPALASFANLLGLMLFISAIAMGVFHLGGSSRPRTWRGRVVDISSYDSGWWASLQRRWRVWWRKRRW